MNRSPGGVYARSPGGVRSARSHTPPWHFYYFESLPLTKVLDAEMRPTLQWSAAWGGQRNAKGAVLALMSDTRSAYTSDGSALRSIRLALNYDSVERVLSSNEDRSVTHNGVSLGRLHHQALLYDGAKFKGLRRVYGAGNGELATADTESKNAWFRCHVICRRTRTTLANRTSLLNSSDYDAEKQLGSVVYDEDSSDGYRVVRKEILRHVGAGYTDAGSLSARLNLTGLLRPTDGLLPRPDQSPYADEHYVWGSYDGGHVGEPSYGTSLDEDYAGSGGAYNLSLTDYDAGGLYGHVNFDALPYNRGIDDEEYLNANIRAYQDTVAFFSYAQHTNASIYDGAHRDESVSFATYDGDAVVSHNPMMEIDFGEALP